MNFPIGTSHETAETWHYQKVCDKALLPEPPAQRTWEFAGFFYGWACWFAKPVNNPTETWERAINHQVNNLIPMGIDTPVFQVNDAVQNTQLLTDSIAQYIPGTSVDVHHPYVPPKRHGVIEPFTRNDAGVFFQNNNPKTVPNHHRVNFGSWGIWYVRPELLEKVEQS